MKALPNLAVGCAGAKSGLPVSDKVRAVTCNRFVNLGNLGIFIILISNG